MNFSKLTQIGLVILLVLQIAILSGCGQYRQLTKVDDPPGEPTTEDPVGQTVRSGDKITGPWLWMIAPTARGQGGARSIHVDSLSDASGGAVTEADVAANGANEGDLVANLAWTLGEISDTGGSDTGNVNDLVNEIGFAVGNVADHSSYALITLESTSAQNHVTMQVGSDDAIKVWLNGEVVHNNPVDRPAVGFQDAFPVNLRQGDNLLLVKVSERAGGWVMFVGIDANVNAIYKPASTQSSVL